MTRVVMGLLGSGEFDPWSVPVERRLLARSRNPGGLALILPTAAAHEGGDSFQRWGSKGLEHFGLLDVRAEVVPLRTRGDADRDDVAIRLDDAALVYFSGGNPARLAAALRGSAFWERLRAAMREGLPYAGCSAGVAALTDRTYDSDTESFETMWQPGLGFVRRMLFGPHWDIVDTWVAGARNFIVASVEDGEVFVGLDEDTAMVGDGGTWDVLGRGRIHVLREGSWTSFGDGDAFELALELDL